MVRIINWDDGERLARWVVQDEVRANYPDCHMLIRSGDQLQYRKKGESDLLACSLSEEILEFGEGDVVCIREDGTLYRERAASEGEADIFITNKCNSNCIMCPLSEGERRRADTRDLTWFQEYIDALPEHISYINITGGEPTLGRETFFAVLGLLKDKFHDATFQLLTNGRSVSDLRLLQRILNEGPSAMLYAIPLHSSDPKIHDAITQTDGSFRQTDRGIRNLLHAAQKVELRIVISQANIDAIPETAAYIAREYKSVFSVNFIAMEMMGNAARNRDSLWIDYKDIFPRLKHSIDFLIEQGIDVQLYNFPHCTVDRNYWGIVANSITSYKIRYQEICEMCAVRQACGGVFRSTMVLMQPTIIPVVYDEE